MKRAASLRRASILAALACGLGCTTAETGVIDLSAAPSALPGSGAKVPPPMPRPMPSPMPPPPPPLDSTVECTTDTDCTRDPTRTHCDVAHARCVGCLGDADCLVGEHCAKDGTCQK